jgi:isopentenyldiphosphate isomerase
MPCARDVPAEARGPRREGQAWGDRGSKHNNAHVRNNVNMHALKFSSHFFNIPFRLILVERRGKSRLTR